MRDSASMKRGLATLAVHTARESAGLGPSGERSHIPPLYQTSNFLYPDADAADQAAAGAAFLYSRHGNPTCRALERAIAEMEGGEGGLTFASGMAAMAASVFALAEGGEVVASEGLYGGSIQLLSEVGPRHGVVTRFVPAWDLEAVRGAIGAQTRALLVETVSNPLLRVADLEALGRLARERSLALIVDATFTTPCLARPLERGATVVVHSVSKYIGGHGDIIGGVVAANAATLKRLEAYQVLLGAVMDPFCAWLCLRGLRTLPLRMERQCASAARLAQVLSGLPGVRRVHYPGLPDHPDHAVARAMLAAGGAMVSFELADGQAARRFYDRVKVIARAASLGDVASLLTHPASFSHKGVPPDERRRLGIGEGLLRLSVGIEDLSDLEADLRQALGG
jgi:cystathionine beta-lyase/cystathionine gamma-synthase